MNAHTTIAPPAGKQAPGAYIRECRERAGLSRAQCAARIAVACHDVHRAGADLAALEAERPGDYLRLVQLLRDRKVFAFSFDHFASLAAATADPALDPWAEI